MSVQELSTLNLNGTDYNIKDATARYVLEQLNIDVPHMLAKTGIDGFRVTVPDSAGYTDYAAILTAIIHDSIGKISQLQSIMIEASGDVTFVPALNSELQGIVDCELEGYQTLNLKIANADNHTRVTLIGPSDVLKSIETYDASTVENPYMFSSMNIVMKSYNTGYYGTEFETEITPSDRIEIGIVCPEYNDGAYTDLATFISDNDLLYDGYETSFDLLPYITPYTDEGNLMMYQLPIVAKYPGTNILDITILKQLFNDYGICASDNINGTNTIICFNVSRYYFDMPEEQTYTNSRIFTFKPVIRIAEGDSIIDDLTYVGLTSADICKNLSIVMYLSGFSGDGGFQSNNETIDETTGCYIFTDMPISVNTYLYASIYTDLQIHGDWFSGYWKTSGTADDVVRYVQ